MTKKRNTNKDTSSGRTGIGPMVLIGGGALFVVAILYATGAFSFLEGNGA